MKRHKWLVGRDGSHLHAEYVQEAGSEVAVDESNGGDQHIRDVAVPDVAPIVLVPEARPPVSLHVNEGQF